MIGDGQVTAGSSLNSSAQIIVGGSGNTVPISVLESPQKLAQFTGIGGCHSCRFKFFVENDGTTQDSETHPVFIVHWWGGDHEVSPFKETDWLYKENKNPITVELYSSGGVLSKQMWAGLNGERISFGTLKYHWYDNSGHSGTEPLGSLEYKGFSPAPGITWQSANVIDLQADSKGKWNTSWTVKATGYTAPLYGLVTSNIPISVGGSELSTEIEVQPNVRPTTDVYQWYNATMRFDISGVVTEPTQYSVNLTITFA
ncbi:hypothetical protein FK765_25885 [Escherichia coli]|nr:hypothetical protein [Escherichia coli]